MSKSEPMNLDRVEGLLALAKDELKKGGDHQNLLKNAVEPVETLLQSVKSSFGKGMTNLSSYQSSLRSASKKLAQALADQI